jgi:hypothetical protein
VNPVPKLEEEAEEEPEIITAQYRPHCLFFLDKGDLCL